MKRIRHRFVHPDPERILKKEPEKNPKKVQKPEAVVLSEPKEISAALKDLKGSFVAMAVLTLILVAFYLADKRFNFIDLAKDLI